MKTWHDFASPKKGRSGLLQLDGRAMLEHALASHDWPDTLVALAALTVFVDPTVAAQIGVNPVFRTARNGRERGKHNHACNYLYDDNSTPRVAFQCATGIAFDSPHMQVAHLYAESGEVNLYTRLHNLVMIPSFLVRLSDYQSSNIQHAWNDRPHVQILHYRTQELYGFQHQNVGQVPCPAAYTSLSWARFAPAIHTSSVRDRLQDYVNRNPGSRAAKSVKLCKWGF
jgi:hypothetical protein